MFLGYGIHQLLKTCVAIEATRRLSEDRRSGALELILVTPLPVGQILRGIKLSLFDIFLWPLGLALLINGGLVWLIVGPDPMHMRSEPGIIFCSMAIGGAIVLVTDFVALMWTGMVMALQRPKHQRAILATFGRVMLVPWLAILLFVFLSANGAGWSTGEFEGILVIWFFGCIMLDLTVATRAQWRLAKEFRQSSQATGSSRSIEDVDVVKTVEVS
jgi:hypothetical protein